MKFLIIDNQSGIEVWINSTEIAAMIDYEGEGYKTEIVLKNGKSFKATATCEEIFKIVQAHIDEETMLVRV